MLEKVLEQTTAFLAEMPKSKRKKIGQFFTSKETAVYMADMFDFSILPGDVEILDPGAGSGILSAAIVERLQKEPRITSIHLTCYETDPAVLPLLKSNLDYICEEAEKKITYDVLEEDYILSQSNDFEGNLFARKNPPKYHLIIGNPPYLRVLRDNPAAVSMPSVVYGAPNLYFLFTSMSLFNLYDECELVYIIPRSWTSGAYFKAFREYLLSYGKIEHIHLFVSRDKVFNQEEVLQETIILKIKRTKKKPEYVLLTSSQSNSDFNNISKLQVPYDSVVTGKDLYVFLPTSEEDIKTIETINKYSDTMPDLGFKMKTGIIVDFRQYDDLRKEPGDHVVPLFYSQHIKKGRVNHESSGKEFDWVIDTKPGLVQKNKDYVFCKRFTAKEERRRLQCGIYLAEDFSEFDQIGTQNKINFVEKIDGSSMSRCLVYGIFALLNSTLFDQYYRILNGSTQVNSTEVNSIPVPPIDFIETIGRKLQGLKDLTTETCDDVIYEVAYGEN